MITTRTEKLEQLLTENCRKALAEIDEVIQARGFDDIDLEERDVGFPFQLKTELTVGEEVLVKEVLTLAGWKNVDLRKSWGHFYF